MINDEERLEIYELELFEICNWDKRKKCDSLYIRENKILKKKIIQTLEINEDCKDEETKKKIKKILEGLCL